MLRFLFCLKKRILPLELQQNYRYLELDTWYRSQREVGPNHAHNATILTAQLTVPHRNQLKEHECKHTHTETNSVSKLFDIPVCWLDNQ